MEKSTHHGHCQACGRLQLLPGGVLAKHGYKVAGFGFFMGTCRGSDRNPLEVDRTITDQIIVDLGAYADRQDARAARLTAGDEVLDEVDSGKQQKVEYMRNGRQSWRWVAIMVAWADADEYQRRRAIERAVFGCNREAKQARSFAGDLQKLIARVHGQPLKPVVDQATVVCAANAKAGDLVKMHGKTYALVAPASQLNRRSWPHRDVAGWTIRNTENGRQFFESNAVITRALKRG